LLSCARRCHASIAFRISRNRSRASKSCPRESEGAHEIALARHRSRRHRARGVFALSLALRVLSHPNAFREGQAQLVPFDDLYHAKRILFSASHFPRVLDFDADRGLSGSFCPWPPLYDLAQAAQAQLLRARGPGEILRSALWFPPVFTAVFAGALAFLLARKSGTVAGLLSGLAVALSPGLVIASHLGAVDHHFLEPALLLVIVSAAVSVGKARSTPSAVGYGVLFGLALALALLMQTAMLFAAGLALAAVLLVHRRAGAALESAALGFVLAAVVVLLYRLDRPDGYPDGPWYLGSPHVAALLGAAAACGVAAWWRREGRRHASFPAGVATGLLVGSLAALSVPGAVSGFSEGLRFFGGDPGCGRSWSSDLSSWRRGSTRSWTSVFSEAEPCS
jgi:asparagine N-glycosylation enzyme membrane subunit Stt3